MIMSELTKLDVTNIANIIDELKAAARLRATDKPSEPERDFSHLQPHNLETEGWIDLKAGYLRPKEVPFCLRCQQGWMYQWLDNRMAQIASMCPRCELPRRWLKRLDKMRLPSDAINMSFSTYEFDSDEQRQAVGSMLEHMKNGCKGQPNGLFLYGPPGNGKTSLLYCFAREAAYLGLKVKYISHIGIMNQIKASWKDKNNKDPLKDWLAGIDLLLIDEFAGVGGSANKSPWWLSQTVELIQEIYQQWGAGELSVVMTSNVYPHQLLNIFSENPAVKSRLGAMFPRPIEMVGRDRRLDQVDMSAWGVR
jgi:DNA replication protein DnaC